VLSALNADHCVPPDAYFERRVDALRAAVELVGTASSMRALPKESPTIA
jgi:hypothetical protein